MPSILSKITNRVKEGGAAATAKLLIRQVPGTKGEEELKKLLLANIDGTEEDKAKTFVDWIIAEEAGLCKVAQVTAEQTPDQVLRDNLRRAQTECKPPPAGYIAEVVKDCVASGKLANYPLDLKELSPTGSVGSIAAVHRCGAVVLKVSLDYNLDTLQKQSVYLPKIAKWPFLSKTPLVNLVNMFSSAVPGWKREFNMYEEAGALLMFNTWVQKNAIEELKFPESKAASRRVLVMSFESGVLCKFLSPDQQKKCISKILELNSKTLFAIRRIHGDPHPGNILLNENGEVVLLDWGTVSVYSDEQVASFRIIFINLPQYMEGTADASVVKDIANAMLALGFTTTKNSDKGLADLARDAFDSRREVPFELMKKGAYGCKDDPVVTAFPEEMVPFLRFRSVLSGSLRRLRDAYQDAELDGDHVFDEINLISQFSKVARDDAYVQEQAQAYEELKAQVQAKLAVQAPHYDEEMAASATQEVENQAVSEDDQAAEDGDQPEEDQLREDQAVDEAHEGEPAAKRMKLNSDAPSPTDASIGA